MNKSYDESKLKIHSRFIRRVDFDVDREHFNLDLIFDCGQCFRWQKYGDEYVGIVEGSLLVVRLCSSFEVYIYHKDLTDTQLIHYFSLNDDYRHMAEYLERSDEVLKKVLPVARGIRLLRQPLFETLISFIISANNNIPKIKKSIESLCELFGENIGSLEYEGRKVDLFAFPKMEVLYENLDGISEVKAIGYRDKSIRNTVIMLMESGVDLEELRECSPEALTKRLLEFSGVGPKVASCISLFGYSAINSFPVDTWIKKMLFELYGVEKDYEKFVQKNFTMYGGLAQQYLFYYMRYVHSNSLRSEKSLDGP